MTGPFSTKAKRKAVYNEIDALLRPLGCSVTFEEAAPPLGEAHIAISHESGPSTDVWIDRKDTILMAHVYGSPAPLARETELLGDVNVYHRRKATIYGADADQLATRLARLYALVESGEAYEKETA